ncbi:MAG: aspartyl-phosphate phosphatase Spo0E family protein [Clostridiaceae bacterium]|nr:aspartyl-phosphate phosphatase Spo0E family protein [Clostridiaceae bacterium]
MTKKQCEMEDLRKKLNKTLEENKGVITEDVIKISQQLDKVIVEKTKKQKNKD